MNRPLFIFRPEPGWSDTARAAREMGLAVTGQPLFDIVPIDWVAPDPAPFDAIVAGSANAFRPASEELAHLTDLPVFAVGEATSEAARLAGFRIVERGTGGLQVLLDGLAGRRLRLLRLAGETHLAARTPPGVEIDTLVVYGASMNALEDDIAQALGGGGVVLLHSGEAATHLLAECHRLGVDRGILALAVLAPRIACLAGTGWQAVHTASTPQDAALLALARELCQTG